MLYFYFDVNSFASPGQTFWHVWYFAFCLYMYLLGFSFEYWFKLDCLKKEQQNQLVAEEKKRNILAMLHKVTAISVAQFSWHRCSAVYVLLHTLFIVSVFILLAVTSLQYINRAYPYYWAGTTLNGLLYCMFLLCGLDNDAVYPAAAQVWRRVEPPSQTGSDGVRASHHPAKDFLRSDSQQEHHHSTQKRGGETLSGPVSEPSQ